MKSKIIKVLNSMNTPSKMAARQIELQKRLLILIELYGHENTALAAGLSESTLRQYTRVKKPMSIGEQCVNQAEKVLQQINP